MNVKAKRSVCVLPVHNAPSEHDCKMVVQKLSKIVQLREKYNIHNMKRKRTHPDSLDIWFISLLIKAISPNL